VTAVTRAKKRGAREKRPVGHDPLDEIMTPRLRPKPLSKADLYRILQDAVRNTAAMAPPKNGEAKHAKPKPKAT